MDSTLAIFTKPPMAGFVKTRLTPPLLAADAARLQGAFILDTLRKAGVVTDRPTIYYAGGKIVIQEALWESHLVLPPVQWKPQGGGDLGSRMARVPAPCVIIGTDLPTLPVAILRQALERIGGNDVVLGPSVDGGYYLIGLSAPYPELFEDIAWGTDRVLSQTQERAAALGLQTEMLPEWYDVDTVDDLRRLQQDLATLPSGAEDDCPATRALLPLLSF